MRNRYDIAEDLLSWATIPEQAKTILGDLLESQPNLLTFWLAVLRTTASLARHQPRRALIAFLWFMYEPAFLALVLTLFAEGKHIPSPYALASAVVGVVCICYWILWVQKRVPSVITSVWFWIDLLKYAGLSKLAILLLVPLNPFFWWVHWQQYQRKRAAELSGAAHA